MADDDIVNTVLYRGDQPPYHCDSYSESSTDDFSTLPATPTSIMNKRTKKPSPRHVNTSLLLDTDLYATNVAIRDDDTSAGSGEEWEASDSTVAKLRRELKNARIDLELEKSNKKKREKSLLRLAKQLKKREDSDKTRNKMIEELEETVADLQERLRSKTSTSNGEVSKLRSFLAEKEKELEEFQLNRQQTPIRSYSRKASSLSIFVSFLWLSAWAAFGTAIIVCIIPEPTMTTMVNILCAPVPPGMIIDTSIPQLKPLEPPFWVPKTYKQSVFSALCDKRPFVTLRFGDLKLHLSDSQSKQITHKAPGGVAVGMDTMTLIDNKRKTRARIIPNPWNLQQQ